MALVGLAGARIDDRGDDGTYPSHDLDIGADGALRFHRVASAHDLVFGKVHSCVSPPYIEASFAVANGHHIKSSTYMCEICSSDVLSEICTRYIK